VACAKLQKYGNKTPTMTTFSEIRKAVAYIVVFLVTLYFCGNANADPIDFTFTGTGVNGSQASGSFTTSTNLDPFYFSNGAIYSAFSLTIDAIPGSGPASVSFDLIEMQSSWLHVDGSGTVFIAPYGSHNFGMPDMHHYDLGQPAQPNYPGSFTFETWLTYDGRYVDTITWSIASPASASVPDSGSTAAMVFGTALMLGAGSWRRLRRD
jgi:hypothetical protein